MHMDQTAFKILSISGSGRICMEPAAILLFVEGTPLPEAKMTFVILL